MKLFRVFYLRSVLTECDALRIINPRDIGPPDGILCAVGNHDVSAGCGGIYLPGGRVSIGGAALVDGEGTEADAHSQAEADAHTVVHITQPGTYVLSGELSAGQIAVDLGEGAETDPEAVVTLVLDGVDITCTVAPAVMLSLIHICAGQGY